VKKVIALAVLAGSLAVVGQAGAADYKVFLGEQSRPPAGTPKGTTLDAFLPGSVTIHAGDTVTFSSRSFHTATIGTFYPLVVRDPAHGKYAPLPDAAGENFWTTGLPKLIYNPRALAPYGPKAITPGAQASSGALEPRGPTAKPATATFSFPKPGTYKFFCTIHPGMDGTVVVKPAGTAVPKTPAQVAAQALADTTAAWNKAKQDAAAAKPPAKHVWMGVGSAATVYAYFPSNLKVKVGTTVTFDLKAPREAHDVVFGPKSYYKTLARKTDLFPTSPTGPNQVAPVIPYGSEPKNGYRYDGKNHGNGFLATPVSAPRRLGPLSTSSKVTFTKPGTYKYFCWIHGPDMGGTIVVTP
jgi:plastocyanin